MFSYALLCKFLFSLFLFINNFSYFLNIIYEIMKIYFLRLESKLTLIFFFRIHI
jgi:hypothetical protein